MGSRCQRPLYLGVARSGPTPTPTLTLTVWSLVFLGQGIVLASLFAVSHNIGQTKDARWLETNRLRDDWAVQQMVTSANWGSTLGCFFTGGLNLQIEHHLFPAISFMHYPAISKIAKVRSRLWPHSYE